MLQNVEYVSIANNKMCVVAMNENDETATN